MPGGLVTAVRTLTLLPFPGRDAERFCDSLFWFPLVGLLLGLFEAGVAWGVVLVSGWNELAAFATVLAGAILTRGVHIDGLADLADGFFGGRDREQRLRIMKDPTVGSFGAVSLVLLMLLKWIAALRLAEAGAFGAIASGVVLARMAQVLLAERLPYARTEGGTATNFVNGAGWRHLLVALFSASVLVCLLLGFDLARVTLLLVTAFLMATGVGVLAWRKIGGVTGDVLGAVSELSEVMVWTAGAMILH